MSVAAGGRRLTAMTTTSSPSDTTLRELASRTNDGIDVLLLWRPADDAVLLHLEDHKLDLCFAQEIDRAEALHAFEHPFAYMDESSLCGRASSRYETPTTPISASTSGAAQTW
jgi:hypothetical protein